MKQGAKKLLLWCFCILLAIGSGLPVRASSETDRCADREWQAMASSETDRCADREWQAMVLAETDRADESGQKKNEQVFDQAGLLSELEVDRLLQYVERAERSTSWDLMLVSVAETDGMDAQTYAEEWADTHTAKEDGVIGLIDLKHRELILSAFGEAIYYLTDERREEILDRAYSGAHDADYAQAFTAMVEGIEEFYLRGIPDGQYTYDQETGEIVKYQKKRQITRFELILSLAAALLAGAAAGSAVIGRYRLKWGGYQYSWRENGRVALDRREDTFLNQIITHRRIPKNTSKGSKGGGRSTVHTGSGGRKFSSSSRKF